MNENELWKIFAGLGTVESYLNYSRCKNRGNDDDDAGNKNDRACAKLQCNK